MRSLIHPGPRKNFPGFMPDHGSVNITLTLLKPLARSPYAQSSVSVTLGYISATGETDEQGIFTLYLLDVARRDPLPTGPLLLEIDEGPRITIPCGLFFNAVITKEVYFPPMAIASPARTTTDVTPERTVCLVPKGSSRTVTVHAPGTEGAVHVECIKGNEALLIFPYKKLPFEIPTSSRTQDLSIRGVDVGDVLSLRLRSQTPAQQLEFEAHVVKQAPEDLPTLRSRLGTASKRATTSQVVAKEIKDLLKHLSKKENLPEENEDSEDWDELEAAISLETFVTRHRDNRIFLIGEGHGNPEDLEVVWKIIRALHAPPHHKVHLMFEQIPFHDLRLTVGPRASVDFTTGLEALNAGLITPELFNEWTNWSEYWTNPKEDEKILTLLRRSVQAGITVSGLDLQKAGDLQTGDIHRDPFMRDRILALRSEPTRVIVTINGLAHLLGKDSAKLLGLGRLLREEEQPVVTLRPHAGENEEQFLKRPDADDYQFMVKGYKA